jgi:hypothetical protein
MTDRSPTRTLAARVLRRSFALGLCCTAVAWLVALPCSAADVVDAPAALFDAPPLPLPAIEAPPAAAAPSDQIYLVSTRGLGLRCDAAAMASGLRCEQLVVDARGERRWEKISWDDLLASFREPLPTVIYVHGNRVESTADKSHGLSFYRPLAQSKRSGARLRYIIWSWPASQIRGQVKDYEVKAARTRPVGWQLAWAIDQLPADAPLALAGYSYGARVVTGALHVLGGGSLDGLKLAQRVHPRRRPLRVGLVAAAVDAAWLRPSGYHGRASSQIESLLLVNNQLDPAMRFYPISPVGRHATALGYSGVSLPSLAGRVRSFDMTSVVGRHHTLSEYLASGQFGRMLSQLVDLPPTAPLVQDAVAADASAVGSLQ